MDCGAMLPGLPSKLGYFASLVTLRPTSYSAVPQLSCL